MHLPLQHRDEGFQLHIKGGLFQRVVPGGLFPGHIVPSLEEHFPELGGGSHPSGVPLVPVAALGVLPKSALHGHLRLDDHVVHAVSPCLDGHEGAAQHIGAAGTGPHGSDAPGQGHMYGFVLGVEAVDAP